MMARLLTRRRMFGLLMAMVVAQVVGCAPYMVGNRTLYPCTVRTVYVPMFESNSFRRHLGERLTEAVIKEIELKTPYKVVNTPAADSVLTGRIVSDLKGVLVEAPTDEPREIQVNMKVEVSWLDRQGQMLRDMQPMAVPSALAVVDQSSSFVPEAGHSITTAQQAVIERLAQQIVSLMETPW